MYGSSNTVTAFSTIIKRNLNLVFRRQFYGNPKHHHRWPSTDNRTDYISSESHHRVAATSTEGNPQDLHCICNVVYRVRWGTVDDVVKSLQSDPACLGIRVSETMVVDLLQKFGDDWKSALGLFRWAGMQPGYECGSCAYNKMVDVLGKMKQIFAMWMLVGEMHRRGLVNVETIEKTMRRLTAAGRLEEAVMLFDGLDTMCMGLRKDVEMMNVLLDTLCKEKKVDIASEVVAAYKRDIGMDAKTFNIFVHGWCLIGRIDKAEEVILEMKENGIAPSVVTYSNVIRAHCDQSNFCKVFEILDQMADEGCSPNVITYTSIINSLARLGDIDAISEIVDQMMVAGCQPDIYFYNSLISILGRAGRLQEACHVFDVEMCRNGVSPDLSTYNCLISIMCQHSLVQEALDLLKRIEQFNLKPNLHTFSPLLKLFVRIEDVDGVLCNLLNEIVNRHHLFLDSSTYDLLIRGFCVSGRWRNAFLLFEEMLSRDIFPRDAKTYYLLLGEAERRGLSDTVGWIKCHLHYKRLT